MHKSDCALHNAPAFAPEPCDCGATHGAKRAFEWAKRLALYLTGRL